MHADTELTRALTDTRTMWTRRPPLKMIRIPLVATIAIGLLASSAVRVAAQDEVAAPVEFSSRLSLVDQPAAGQTETLQDGTVRTIGRAWRFQFEETSDPRFDGTMTATITEDRYADSSIELQVNAYRIENDGGAWQEVPSYALNHSTAPGATFERFFIGEGGYEGLIAAVRNTWTTGWGFELHGFIIEGHLPSIPEPWSTE
jgi:hypothetical protein